MGAGPQQREFHQEILQAKQAGSGRRIQKNSVPLPLSYD
ncbi:nitrogen fixation protein NifR [Staphylococcus haemolyticus]|nr:nitrogen fixation protein NifR [Staphylococcus haemolyticus]